MGTGALAGAAHGGFGQYFLHQEMLIHQRQNFDFLFLFNWEYVGFAKKYPQVLHAIWRENVQPEVFSVVRACAGNTTVQPTVRSLLE